MSRFKDLTGNHVAASMIKDRNSYTFRPTKANGTPSYVHGTIACGICCTGNPVKGRPGQAVINYEFACRTCSVKNVISSVTFACNN